MIVQVRIKRFRRRTKWDDRMRYRGNTKSNQRSIHLEISLHLHEF